MHRRNAVALLSLAGASIARCAADPVATFHKEILWSFDEARDKVLALANAIPADKYGWRPAPKVRSVGEVFQHIANGTRLQLTFTRKTPLGRQALNQMIESNEKLEQTNTDKDKIIAELKGSFDEARQAIQSVAAADLEKPVKFFNTDTTLRGVFFAIVNHALEHMGQSIAYARMIGVVPPWSRG
jgi:uncharacterized damage-inducible protein DinB